MPRLKMSWKRKTNEPSNTLWTCGDWAIELTSVGYELYHLATFVGGFAELEAAKNHAKSEAYNELPAARMGRPPSPERCEECGASPAHQRR